MEVPHMSSISTEPSWLNKDYVGQIMKQFSNDKNVVIENFTKKSLTSKCENYFAKLYLLTVSYSIETSKKPLKNVSLVLKCRLENEYMSTIEEHSDIFGREAQYYKVISKEMKKILHDISDNTSFSPQVFYVDDRLIVLENLRLKEYYIHNVKLGLNLNQCTLALQKLAKFHACSMVLYQKNPDIFRFHLRGNISEHNSVLHDLYTKGIKSTVDYCNREGKLKKYAKKLEKFSATIIAKLIHAYSRSSADRFHVFNHGDMWINNLMFQKPNDQELFFIDFHQGFYGSPGIDWNYFIYTSWQPYVFQLHFNDLIMVYHESLVDVLHKLNYKQRIPTIDDVKKEIINKAFHGLATATCILPILINEHPELANTENFILDTEEAVQNRCTILNNLNFAERLNIFLKYFDDVKIL